MSIKKIQKIARFNAVVALIFGMLFLNIAPAFAASPLSKSDLANLLTGGAAKITQKINEYIKGFLKDKLNGASTTPADYGTIVESMQSKMKGPNVTVTFAADGSGGIKTGATVIATAVPSLFADQNKLYYTWYIKHKDCGLRDNLANYSQNIKNECDLDGDDHITENDWKIAAARIIVGGSFDRANADYGDTSDHDKDNAKKDTLGGVDAVPSVKDKNGWRISTRYDENGNISNDLTTENTGSQDVPNCYVQNPETGQFIELKNTETTYSCPNDANGKPYHMACVRDVNPTCNKPNPTYDPVAFNAAVAGLLIWGDFGNNKSGVDVRPDALIKWNNLSQAARDGYKTTWDSLDQTTKNTHVSNWGAVANQSVWDNMTLAAQVVMLNFWFSDSVLFEIMAAQIPPGVPAAYNVPKFVPINLSTSYTVPETHLLTVCQEDSAYSYTDTTGKTDPAAASVGCNDDLDTSNNEGTPMCIPGTAAAGSSIFGGGDQIPGDDTKLPLAKSGDTFDAAPSDPDLGPFYGAIFGKSATTSKICSRIGDIDGTSFLSTQEVPGQANGTISGLAKSIDGSGLYFGETPQSKCAAAINDLAYLQTNMVNPYKITKNSVGSTNACKHLFPYFPEKDVNFKNIAEDADGNVEVNADNSVKMVDKWIHLADATTGDGKFSMAEKAFWGADPDVASTNGKQQDEAAVMGLGVDTFSWKFEDGDMVGVAVEGDSILPSDHIDASAKRMWAFSNGGCSSDTLKDIGLGPDDTTDYKQREGTSVNQVTITAGTFDSGKSLDDCLEESLMEPAEQGASDMKVDLTAIPANPMNDPDGRGDVVTITAAVSNSTDLGLSYKWRVYKTLNGETGNTAAWREIPEADSNCNTTPSTNKDFDCNKIPHSSFEGVGQNEFTFTANFPDSVLSKSNPANWLKVTVEASENLANGGGVKNLKGETIINLQEQQNSMEAYFVTANTDGLLTLNEKLADGSDAPKPCDNQTNGKAQCLVTKDQIVGIKIGNTDGDLSGFSWKVNGVAMTCSGVIAADLCSSSGDSSNNEFFFPILGNEGEAVDVVATAKSATKGIVEISKHFVIVAPQVQIVSMDSQSVWQKLMGVYKTLGITETEDSAYADLSSEVFETNSGKIAELGAIVYSAWNSGNAYKWSIDGDVQESSICKDGSVCTANVCHDGSACSDGSSISFSINKSAGDNYNIGLMVVPSPDQTAVNNLRRALKNGWGVSPEDSVINNNSASVQINVVEDSSVTVANLDQTGIFASLITHLPEQFMFLLKIILAAFMLIFSMGLLFAFVPDSLFEKRK